MKRVIFSFYIDIPKEELDIFDKELPIVKNKKALPINLITKDRLKKHYVRLLIQKQSYAKKLGYEFKLFEYGPDWILFEQKLKREHPYLTTYNIVNFYKIHLLYELAKQYDEVLYLDFDVVPMQDVDFFEHWDLTKGIAVLNNNDRVLVPENVDDSSTTIRSPTAKFYNAQAMLFEKGLSTKNDVINTGIIGASAEHLNTLAYFKDFDKNLKLMTNLTKESDSHPPRFLKYFGWDNETLFAVKIKENNVPILWLDDKWHYFFSNQRHVPQKVILCHAINKDFETVWRVMDA
tara:strand:+ start:1082 stop:1954 length:873 start_codon:yes stop_codon:yes gene_type:complete